MRRIGPHPLAKGRGTCRWNESPTSDRDLGFKLCSCERSPDFDSWMKVIRVDSRLISEIDKHSEYSWWVLTSTTSTKATPRSLAICVGGWARPVGHVERCDVSLTEETTNTKHTHKQSEAQWPSDTIHTKLVSKTLINPDYDCGYAIYLTFNNAKGFISHLTVRLLWWGVIHNQF